MESYWEEFRESYPYFYEKDYGPLRAVVERTVTRFLECGIFRHGFARVRCAHCQHEYLLTFSCKTRYFCPSCQAKRVAAFVEWVNEEILEPVDHRQCVWTIPWVLRPSFRRDRRLLGELARCAWKTLQEYSIAWEPLSPSRPMEISSPTLVHTGVGKPGTTHLPFGDLMFQVHKTGHERLQEQAPSEVPFNTASTLDGASALDQSKKRVKQTDSVFSKLPTHLHLSVAQ